MAVAETYGSNGLSSIQSGGKADPFYHRGVVRNIYEYAAVAAADDNNSQYILGYINSGEVPMTFTIIHSAITNGTDYNIGLCAIDDDGTLGAVVSDNVFADALNLSSAGTKDGLATIHATLTNHGKKVWEMLGLTEDPGLKYAIVATGIAVGTAAGTIVLKGEVLAIS